MDRKVKRQKGRESEEGRINKGEEVRDPGPEKLRKTQEVKKQGEGGQHRRPTQEKPTMAMGPRKSLTRPLPAPSPLSRCPLPLCPAWPSSAPAPVASLRSVYF